jgi:hypothetical protein
MPQQRSPEYAVSAVVQAGRQNYLTTEESRTALPVHGLLLPRQKLKSGWRAWGQSSNWWKRQLYKRADTVNKEYGLYGTPPPSRVLAAVACRVEQM